MPLFVWAHYATAIIQVLGTPVVAITILLVALERIFHFGFFDPTRGGDPILFQHLFWFYSHPAVYIMILPSMGVISELITCFSRKRVFGYSFIAMSSLAIAAIGFLVWAHHMFVSGHVGLLGDGLLGPHLPRGHPLRDQDLQLDGDPLQGLDLVGHADDLRVLLHRPLPDRRADRALPRQPRHRRAPHRHLLRGRPLPLHHGGRRHHGLPRRAPLLVAEDHRPEVLRGVGAALRRRSSSSAST